MNIADMIYYLSPEYTRAFQDGYECAKKEMRDKLNAMTALVETSSTVEAL